MRIVARSRRIDSPTLLLKPPSPQNFLVNAVAAQYNAGLSPSSSGQSGATGGGAEGGSTPHSLSGFAGVLSAALDKIDTSFTIIFTAELALNLYAHWFWRFWSDGW